MGARANVLAGLYIIVVEDDRDSRDILRMVLEYFGALVTTVATAREGLNMLRAIDPSVVIVDMLLGKSDGMEVIREAHQRGTVAPFIAVSGKDLDPLELEGAGFAAYLRKPVDHERLVDTILAIMRDR